MDEQLEQQIEGRGAEAQIEEVLSQAGEEATEETVPEAGNPETEVKTESSAEEKEIPDAELSASEDKDNPEGDDSCPPCLKGDVSEADRGIPPAAAASHKGGEEHAFVIGSELDAAKKIAQLPTSMQARYNDLPKTAQRALIK